MWSAPNDFARLSLMNTGFTSLATCLLSAILWLGLSPGCTSSDIYAVNGINDNPPDRLVIRGELCTEDPAGGAFPAKILFVMDQSQQITNFDPDGQRLGVGSSSALRNVAQVVQGYQYLEHVRFGFIGVSKAARAMPVGGGQVFYKGTEPEVSVALNNYANLLTSPERNVSDAITQVGNFVLSDIANSSAGEIVRSRYVISMLFSGPPDADSMTPKDFGDQIATIRRKVLDRGVMEFQVNVGLLYTGPLAIQEKSAGGYGCFLPDPAETLCPCGGASGTANFCSVHCTLTGGTPATFAAELNRSRLVYEAIAFGGGGLFREFACPSQIDMNLDIGRSQIKLVRKDILAFNRNAQLTPDGYLIDSDGDGLPDIHEINAINPTDPLNFDSDLDGVNDRVELESQKDPLNGNDRPGSCLDPGPLGGVLPDRDFDMLNDCEEALVQAQATVPDSDGDGLPDYIEFRNSMLPGDAIDRLLDFDLDGVMNATEALQHTDPYSNEGLLRGVEAYRNTIVPIGLRQVSTIADSQEFRGLVFRRASPNLQPGQSYMEWDGCTQTFRWSDAGFFGGGRNYEPESLVVPTSGIYTTNAAAANGDRIWAEWLIDPDQMPDCTDGLVTSFPLISSAERNCYDVTISNIKLVETKSAYVDSPIDTDRPVDGTNSIYVFFTQATTSRLSSPGVGRVAEVKARFQCTDPNELSSCLRMPKVGEITLTDDAFVSALPPRG